MNKYFKLLCGGLILSSVFTTGVSARTIKDLDSFRLPAWKAVVKTSAATKSNTNAPWVLNIDDLSNSSSVDTYLANSDGDRRSDYTVVGVGRHEIDSNGQAGYKYRAVLMNHQSSRDNGYLTGTWSPDNR